MYNCELCEYSTKLRADWNKHINTKSHIHMTNVIQKYEIQISNMTNVINQQKQEIADMKKSPKYDSIEDVRSSFFLNAMFMNQTKKEYELQDFGRWIINNRMVCKSLK